MTDSAALRQLVTERGLKLKYIAGRMNLSQYGLQRKIDNKSEFTVGEMLALVDAVGGMTDEQQKQIFFGNSVD